MKKFIILSFMFLFFAGISNNATAQKEPAQTKVIITYDWHCTTNPDANLYVHFDGYDEDGEYQTYNYVGKVGSNPTKVVGSGIRYKSVTVDIDVRAINAWASKTKTAMNPDPNIGFIEDLYVTLDIYSGPPQNPGW